jgi:dienelactone hydrolase
MIQMKTFLSRSIKVIFLMLWGSLISAQEEITPYKFEGSFEQELSKSSYVIPASSRFAVPRNEVDAPEIVYYFTKPKDKERYPIAIVCGGSTTKDDIGSIIHVHRYLLEEFLMLGTAVITVEQWGVDGANVDKEEFMAHYTRTQRLKDHQMVIEHLKLNSPEGWDGTIVFLGVSEGGPLVTSLTECYPDITRATVNWVGAGDWSWHEELWAFLSTFRKNGPWWLKLWNLVPTWMPFSLKLPKTKKEYDQCMKKALADPCVDKDFMGMTYLYHADALQYPAHDYTKIKTPFLSVIGSEDPMIESADAFAQKAKEAGVNITYLRVEGMDHYVRHRPDIVDQSFEWIKEKLND